MANIKINWTNPSDVTGVTGIKVFQKTGSTVPACSDYLSSADALPTDSLPTDVTEVHTTSSAPTPSSADEKTLTGVSAGDYNFAVFAYNEVGFSPCSATTTTTTIS